MRDPHEPDREKPRQQNLEDLIATLEGLFDSQRLAVLATQKDGEPYGNLIAFAASADLKRLFFATLRGARKYANIIAEPRIALVVDNRSNEPSDFVEAVAVTVLGEAREVSEDELPEAAGIYLKKHPELKDFLGSQDCALIRLTVRKYICVSRFQTVPAWSPAEDIISASGQGETPMFRSLPKDATGMMAWSWGDFEPFYAALDKRSLAEETVESFLADWTRLTDLVDETYSRMHVATTVNTQDKAAEERFHRFLDDVFPRVEEAEQSLKTKLLDSGLTPSGFEKPLLRMRTEAEIFRPENLTLFVEEHKLAMEYDKIIGAQTVEWEGKEITVAQLRPVYQSLDRDLREKAWKLAVGRQLEDRAAISHLWRKFMDVRTRLAANAGFPDYRSFRWKQLLRFDYTPDDCRSFHRAIEQVVAPAAGRVYERRRKRLGLEALRPWDLSVDPLGRPPLKPFRETTELRTASSTIFRHVNPAFGEYFDIMVKEGLLDLDNRKNKAPGGYCTEFSAAKRPFIFMNAVGVHDDIQTLLHEAGHAFHAFERSRLPYAQQRHVGMEFAEVASMAMELLAAPYLDREHGGFYSKEEAIRARIEHIEWLILFWPYMAVVDAFQHWVYEYPELSVEADACDEHWVGLWRRFMPEVDWSGLEQELRAGWQLKLHIHTVPFYYVEYGLAQLGAAQVWANSVKDPSEAVSAYRRALSLGGVVSLPELFEAAGASFAFDPETLGRAVAFAEESIEGLLHEG